MKKIICTILCLMLFLCSCSTKEQSPAPTPTEAKPTQTTHKEITQIDHYVVEADDKLHMTDDDRAHYKALMDALLNQSDSVKLSSDEAQNEYYIDLLKQSPYYFFASSCTLNKDTVSFEYAYSKEKQQELLEFIDTEFLKIVNCDFKETDNQLDVILKVYGAVASRMKYDNLRTDNKQIGSPLFNYPSDEIYKAFKDDKSLCYGFAYILRFALLQQGVDCFCVYGPCTDRDEAHMWNIFKYNGKFYTCDSAWDRSENEYKKLYHFGKTDAERLVDRLKVQDFSSTLFEEYGKIECTDEAFEIFRGVCRYDYQSGHTYYVEDYSGETYTFNSETFELI